MNDNKNKIVSLSVDSETLIRMKADAELQGLNLSAFMRELYAVWEQYKDDRQDD